MRKKFLQIKKATSNTSNANNNLDDNDNINNVNSNNKESKSRPTLLDVNENNPLLQSLLTNVSRLSINTQELDYDSDDNNDFVDSQDYY